MKASTSRITPSPEFWTQFRSHIRPDKFGCIHPGALRAFLMGTFGLSIMDVFNWTKANRAQIHRETNKVLAQLGWRLRRRQQPTGYAKAEKLAA